MKNKKFLYIIIIAVFTIFNIFITVNGSKHKDFKEDILIDLNLTIPSIHEYEYAVNRNNEGIKNSFEKENEKGLCMNGYYDYDYITIQALYKKALCYFLNTNLSLHDFDREIKTRENINKKTEESYDKKYFSLDSDFLYVGMDVDISMLDKSDIDYLRGKISNKNVEIDEQILEMVKRTYGVVLRHSLNIYPVPTDISMNALLILSYFDVNDIDYYYDYEKNDLIDLYNKYSELFSEELGHNVEIKSGTR